MTPKRRVGRPRIRPKTKPKRKTTTTPPAVRAFNRNQARKRRNPTRIRPYVPRPNARRITRKKPQKKRR